MKYYIICFPQDTLYGIAFPDDKDNEVVIPDQENSRWASNSKNFFLFK